MNSGKKKVRKGDGKKMAKGDFNIIPLSLKKEK